MAEEEFQESDVIFSDHDHHRHSKRDQDVAEYFAYRERRDDGGNDDDNGTIKCRTNKKNKKMMSSSLPVNIPVDRIFHYVAAIADDFEEENCGGEEGEIVPPHVITGRRIAGKMAFSLCTGNGRTLKGRDLSQVRNKILRMTGFLET